MNGNGFPPDGFRGGMIEVAGRHGNGDSSLLWVVFALVLILLLVVLVSLVLDYYHRSNEPRPEPAEVAGPPGGALAILDTRYASGELTRADYLQARQDILEPGPAAPG